VDGKVRDLYVGYCRFRTADCC